ncbi:MAG: flagellar basal-body rod protein FlgG [Mycobacterium sp.]|nr:flagellar basal-body rod protein FlgG [Mycobacterium sp.]
MRALSTAATGMAAQEMNVEVISNNIANMNTVGYKRQRAEFSDLLYQDIQKAGAQSSDAGTVVPTGIQVGSGVKTGSIYRITAQGSMTQTSNQLDVAIQGRGFLQVSRPDGTVAYTRDGSLHTDPNGQLVTADGNPLEPAITVPPNVQSLTIGSDGTVSATTTASATPQTLGTLQLADFINPAGLQPMGQNLYVESVASGAPQTGQPALNGMGSLLQGSLESSNVNVVAEMVNMIETQRTYEMNSKAISSTVQMLQDLTDKM